MAILIVSEGWNPQGWADMFRRFAPDREIRIWPDTGDRNGIEYAVLWMHPPGSLTGLPNLKALFSLGAGVDHIMRYPDLPNVPVIRVANSDLTNRMSEYVLLHVLLHHRQMLDYGRLQARGRWHHLDQPAACDVRVGVMGLGALGGDAAAKLLMMGFQVAGWSRTPKTVVGVDTFSGNEGLQTFLGRTDILVCLLPLTPETRGLIGASIFKSLARDGVLGGPVFINAARGSIHVESDIVACLNDGTLKAASLDVFEAEPLPADSPLWSHPNVVITPHAAADSEPEPTVRHILRQIDKMEVGHPVGGMVDRSRGY